jgi:D-alanyl-D-alanine carboxypeptidase
MQSLLNSALAKASREVTRKPALVARAPQPTRAKPPAKVAEAPAVAVAPPAARERAAAIAVAKVRSVHIEPNSAPARIEQVEASPEAPQPVFAVAGAGGAASFPRFVPETGALRPSTLQAQAAALEQAEPSPAPAPRQVAARPAPRGPFEIQIGAYADSAEAERSMAAARERTGALLDAYRSVTIPVQNGKLYRARFRGFDATAANTTCSRLKTMQIDCFVTRTE